MEGHGRHTLLQNLTRERVHTPKRQRGIGSKDEVKPFSEDQWDWLLDTMTQSVAAIAGVLTKKFDERFNVTETRYNATTLRSTNKTESISNFYRCIRWW